MRGETPHQSHQEFFHRSCSRSNPPLDHWSEFLLHLGFGCGLQHGQLLVHELLSVLLRLQASLEDLQLLRTEDDEILKIETCPRSQTLRVCHIYSNIYIYVINILYSYILYILYLYAYICVVWGVNV